MHPGTTKAVFLPEHSPINPSPDHSPMIPYPNNILGHFVVFEGNPNSALVCSKHGLIEIFIEKAKVFYSTHEYSVDDIFYNTILSEVINVWLDKSQNLHFLNIKAKLNSLNSIYILRFISEETYEYCFCGSSEAYTESSAEEKLSHDPVTWGKLNACINPNNHETVLGDFSWYNLGLYYSDQESGGMLVKKGNVKTVLNEASIKDSVSSMLGSFEGFYNRTFECPEDGCAVKYILTPSNRNIMHMIIHFNDDHGWSREAIADWLELESERQGFSIEFPDPEV